MRKQEKHQLDDIVNPKFSELKYFAICDRQSEKLILET